MGLPTEDLPGQRVEPRFQFSIGAQKATVLEPHVLQLAGRAFIILVEVAERVQIILRSQ